MIGRAQCPPSIYKGQLMNERIKQLAKQAGYSKDYLEIGLPSNMEKFAELIVRECLSIVDNADRGGSNEIWNNAVKFIRQDLQEHFGVKE
jgi:hypothetical protein